MEERRKQNAPPSIFEGGAKGFYSVEDVGAAASINSRDYMQDTYVVVESFGGNRGTGFFAVYDGHGGMQAATYAATCLHNILLVKLNNGEGDGEKIGTTLEETFIQTDHAMSEAGLMEDGTTATVCLIRPTQDSKREICFANVGDSHSVLCRNGKAVILTKEHRPTNETEKDRIISAGGVIKGKSVSVKKLGMSLQVTRSIGDHFFKQAAPYLICKPDVGTIAIEEGDTHLIIGSDGLWDTIDPQVALDTILAMTFKKTDKNKATMMSDALINLAVEKK